MTPAVLCAGLSCVDHIWRVERFPPTGSRTDASSYRMQGGGPAATAAATVARLGGIAHLWAVHGDDPGGRTALAELRDLGVDVSAVQIVPGAVSWVSSVLVAPDGERFIFPFRGDGLPDRPPSDVARPGDLGCVLVDLRHPRLCASAIEFAHEQGVVCVADAGSARHWELTEGVDVIIASEECAEEVLGRRDPGAALTAMRWRDDQTVGITLGPDGYLYEAGGGPVHLHAYAVETVDTTGAGDVFHGAYAFALAAGGEASRCATFAQAAAALSCRGVGRSALPSLAEVEELLSVSPSRHR